MSLIRELEQLRATLKACSVMIAILIRRWNNGELDTDSSDNGEYSGSDLDLEDSDSPRIVLFNVSPIISSVSSLVVTDVDLDGKEDANV